MQMSPRLTPSTPPGIPVDRDRVDECLVGGFVLVGCDGSRLTVSLCDELRGPHIGYPDLNGPETLLAHPLTVRTYALPRGGHTG